MLMLQTWLVPALFIFLTTESIGELLDPCGYISPESPIILQRVILPSGHLTLLQGTILMQKIKCIQMAISLM
uniref:Uncharacterized protein n=1 Tax=Pongo abelii TaxID=9601 RepID=A0A8I5U4E9_PONAB